MHHRIVGIINTYLLKGILNFSLPFFPDYASLALHAQDVELKPLVSVTSVQYTTGASDTCRWMGVGDSERAQIYEDRQMG